MKNSMYVIFAYDHPEEIGINPGSAIKNGWGFSTWGNFDMFRADECFKSKNKAKRFIQQFLRNGKTSGGSLRPDVNYSNFKIVQVYKCKDSKFYLTNQYEAKRGIG